MPFFKDKKRGTWKIKLYYTDWTGEKRQLQKRGFPSKREAQKYERNFIQKEARQSDILFSNLVENYLEDMKHRLRETTYYGKIRMLKKHIIPFFGNTPINKITASHVRKWQNTMMSHKKKYSDTYLRTINNQLTAVLNYAIKFYSLEKNPCHAAGSMGKKYSDKMQIWTLDEFNSFIAYIDNSLFNLAFNVLFWSGIRVGELLALSVEDIQDGLIKITKSYATVSRKEIVNPPKTPKSIRDITMPQALQDKVNAYISTLHKPNKNDRLFPTNKSTLASKLTKAAKLANIKRIRVHDLRHSHASFLIEQNFNPLIIAERLGHEKVETTLNVYSHLYPNKHIEVAEKLNEFAK
ncbi:MAG: site-specific integrase [Clostridiales bacterium]|jgi:integrase|nr:site-specific integrase [Clostridiales bacterium]